MLKRITIGVLKFVFYIAFVVAAVYFTPKILSKTLNTPYPMATITSGSMWPTLKENDLILMKGIAGSEAQVGDIIIYGNSKGFTIHRLVKKEDPPAGETGIKLITKGDANNVEDPAVTEDKVVGRLLYIGKYPFRIPYLGAIARGLGPKLQQFSK